MPKWTGIMNKFATGEQPWAWGNMFKCLEICLSNQVSQERNRLLSAVSLFLLVRERGVGFPRFKFNFYFLGGGHFKYSYLCGGTPKIIKILVVVPQIINGVPTPQPPGIFSWKSPQLEFYSVQLSKTTLYYQDSKPTNQPFLLLVNTGCKMQ